MSVRLIWHLNFSRVKEQRCLWYHQSYLEYHDTYLNLLAGVLMRGDEASVGGDECDADESMIVRSVISFLISVHNLLTP